MLPETRIVSDVVRRITDTIRREVKEKLGPNATFEQRRDAAAAMASDSPWLDTDLDLREAITTAEEIEVDGRRYRPLAQASSATYHGRWGSHHIEEALYREVGVHNGPTIKPIELRVGIIEHMTPDMARVVGELVRIGVAAAWRRHFAPPGWYHPVERSSRSTPRRWVSRSPTRCVLSNRSRAKPRSSLPRWPR
jgi:hypothetical protein